MKGGKTIKSSKPNPLKNGDDKQVDLENHNKLVEELKPLSLISKAINELNGVKGVFIEEDLISKMFLAGIQIIFAEYMKLMSLEESQTLMQSLSYILLIFGGCCCKSFNQSFDMIVTKIYENDNENAPETIFYVEKETIYTGFYNMASIFMNQNGKSISVGSLLVNSWGFLQMSSKYVNNLQVKYNLCKEASSLSKTTYVLEDDDQNKGTLIKEFIVCQKGLNNFRLGFPPNYNTDQCAITLAGVLYLVFVESNRKTRTESDMYRRY